MLPACALQYGRSWDKSLSYAEFSYNNSYQESLKMALFEMLYGHRCRTLLFWSEAGERKVFGPDILQEAEKQVHMVTREFSFEVRDFVYLEVSPMRCLHHFEVRGKIALWFLGPFKILEK
jgi:hypothetical protein